ncbi:undecaprenyl pyrophosphate synthetase [Desulfitobacterium sp. LBE]|uniref:Isoprenyl transferase n=2 Tax=root TaxID=1 RepID=B8FRG1_DESHD|nr:MULTISPECIES: isoprenyl transferase [Desulfitobacterium]ACL21721.1 undecaprenyl diphosphate synthase [Desulfitobacterium hafniense DCB-2]MEA5024711.1 isoprenyl transferase [Desulfitobacterium hafniense]TWH60505.1 undecaprenyl pyrophosphate synthetase [Desulfitobacterium sp. LBE]
MWHRFWDKKEQSKTLADQLDKNNLPRHIAIIMDGNGRWAQKRGLPRTVGHKAGVEALRDIVKACSNLGIEALTVYAFSTENWSRPKEEVNILMNLLIDYLRRELDELHDNKVRVQMIGNMEQLPLEAQRELKRSIKKTVNNGGLILNLALNYGGRAEITCAVRQLCEKVLKKELTPEEITGELISQHLFTSGLSDPDLLIRTSGELRVSNFLLWQIAYTEIIVTECLWPDFSPDQLVEALLEFQKRERRFGGLNKR